ncbi:MAG TPA: hypothetical protein VGI12_13030 [Vicinamibacterales bacterium]|jgi:hypothetical protein
MRTHPEDEFIAWAERSGFQIDARYPRSAVLTFRPDSEHDRFWEVPIRPERRPYFIASLLECMGDWQACYAWRHLGSWPQSAVPERINDVVELRILHGLGLPLGTNAVVEYPRDEYNSLLTLLFSTTIFGWSVGEDLYVVPDHGKHLLQMDHHGVIHVSFRTEDSLNVCVEEMERRGFPLPDEVPDATFKQPEWMKRGGE